MKALLGIIISVLIIWGGCKLFSNSGETVAEYSQRMEKELNAELADPANQVRKYKEDAHGTVTVKSANVSSISIRTKDGSDNAGKKGSNVSEVKVTIITYWDGILHKNGHTEFSINFDMSSKEPRLKEYGIINTNAKINMTDPKFWYSVGYAIGILLL